MKRQRPTWQILRIIIELFDIVKRSRLFTDLHQMTHQSGQTFRAFFVSHLIVGDGWPIKRTNQFNEEESAPGIFRRRHPLAESGFDKTEAAGQSRLMDTSRSQSLHFFFNISRAQKRKMWR